MIRSNRDWLLYIVLTTTLAGACLFALLTGAVHIPLDQMLQSGIIRLRIARILLAVISGAALSVAGVIFQALLRNPLAEPYILGVSSGAGLGAVVSILLGLAFAGIWTIPLMAFAGGIVTILVVYVLAREADGSVPVHTLLLSGVIIGAVMGSLLRFIISISSTQDLHNETWWLLGSLQVYDWNLLRAVAVVVIACLAVTMAFARDLNVMTLGEEPAVHLGLAVERTKKLFFIIASLMTGATVAACGLIGFVGLIVPHSVRLVVGPDHRRLIPASALAGAIFMVLVDCLARVILSPREIPIGVVTAFLGGPFFLYLLRRRKRRYWG
jgi:iron complex transport system permease protein